MRRLKKRSWIVQQLLIPMYDKADSEISINPFGNILTDISNEDKNGNHTGARDNMAQIFDPAYMGAAEFEWGALPKSLGRMWDNDNIIMQRKSVATIYMHFVGDKDLMNDYRKLLREVFWAYPQAQSDICKDITKNDYGSLYKTLTKADEYDKRLKGWYDLENDFAAFICDDEGTDMACKFLNAVK